MKEERKMLCPLKFQRASKDSDGLITKGAECELSNCMWFINVGCAPGMSGCALKINAIQQIAQGMLKTTIKTFNKTEGEKQ